MTKKYLFWIIIAMIVIATATALVWYFIFSPVSAPQSNISGPNLVLPKKTSKKMFQISSTPTIGAVISEAQNKIFWYDLAGQFWSSGFDGLGASMATFTPIENAVKVIWSLDGAKNFLAAGTNQKNIHYIFTDPLSGALNLLRSNTKTAAFSYDGKKIIYQVTDDSQNTNTLFSSDPDGKNQKTVVQLKLRDVVVSWPQTNLAGFTSKPSGLAGGSLWALNLKTLVFDKLIDNLNGLETLWSPDGDKILFSGTDGNGKNPRLAILNLKGAVKDLGVSTIVKKCAWASNNTDVYCSVPARWPQDAILPDDYYKNAFLAVDDIMKINTDTGQREIVISGISNGENLAVSPAQDFLILILKTNSQLYRVSLK